jgi:CO dehydrogenase maturation factor
MARAGTIAGVTDEFFGERMELPAGMPKEAFLELRLASAISEGRNLDLIVMGHPERAGCYCYVNNVLRAQIEKLAGNYAFVVIDNEAGMEHISRRTTRRIDHLLAVADCSAKALKAAGRIHQLAEDLELSVGRTGLVVNKAADGWRALEPEIAATGLPLLQVIPESRSVLSTDIAGRPVFELPEADPVNVAVKALTETIIAS